MFFIHKDNPCLYGRLEHSRTEQTQNFHTLRRSAIHLAKHIQFHLKTFFLYEKERQTGEYISEQEHGKYVRENGTDQKAGGCRSKRGSESEGHGLDKGEVGKLEGGL